MFSALFIEACEFLINIGRKTSREKRKLTYYINAYVHIHINGMNVIIISSEG